MHSCGLAIKRGGRQASRYSTMYVSSDLEEKERAGRVIDWPVAMSKTAQLHEVKLQLQMSLLSKCLFTYVEYGNEICKLTCHCSAFATS